jgi:hypothetical protein
MICRVPVIAEVLLPGVTSGLTKQGGRGTGLAVAVSGAHPGQSDDARPATTATATISPTTMIAAVAANTIRHGKLASPAAAAATTAAHAQYGVTRVKPHVAAATTPIAAALAAARRV